MRLALAAALLLVFAPAASAAGQDSLLSGYGGPGDGEQALLGQTLIRDSAAGAPATTPSSSTAPPAATAVPAPGPQEIFKPASAAPASHATPAKPKPKPGSSDQSATVTPKPAPTTPPAAIPAARASSGVPAAVGGRDIALAVAVIVVLGVLAGVARRLAVRAGRARRPLPLYEP